MNGLETYQNTAVTTQSKGRLIVLLYEGAIKFCKLAVRAMDAGDLDGKGKYIAKAQDIIWELNSVLNFESGGEVATNLRSLYLYMNRRLNEANISLDPEICDEVIALLGELNESWKSIAD